MIQRVHFLSIERPEDRELREDEGQRIAVVECRLLSSKVHRTGTFQEQALMETHRR